MATHTAHYTSPPFWLWAATPWKGLAYCPSLARSMNSVRLLRSIYTVPPMVTLLIQPALRQRHRVSVPEWSRSLATALALRKGTGGMDGVVNRAPHGL